MGEPVPPGGAKRHPARPPTADCRPPTVWDQGERDATGMIQLTEIHKKFGDNIVLDGVNFEVRDGETVALVGPSGTGKSVLLKHINGLLHPDSGEVLVDGLNVQTLGRKDLAKLRNRIGYVFQFGALFDSMNIAENIKLGITDEKLADDPRYCEDRVYETLDMVNLPAETADKFPADLSGGMKKRVGIARAIAGRPAYLLYDEPTSGLDPVNANIIDMLVEKLQQELGVTSVVITHDVRGCFKVSDRIALLKEGKIRAMSTPQELRDSDDPVVRQFLERDLGNPL
jgi:phospholipid/cholesterol/gamma-HCH transport system ATP-binding protein